MTSEMVLDCDLVTNDDIGYLLQSQADIIESLSEMIDDGVESGAIDEELADSLNEMLDDAGEKLEEILNRCISSIN